MSMIISARYQPQQHAAAAANSVLIFASHTNVKATRAGPQPVHTRAYSVTQLASLPAMQLRCMCTGSLQLQPTDA